VTSIPKDLEWRRTSRNTEIAVGKVAPYGKVFFKRGVLINALELDEHIGSFKLLNNITDKIEGATSPSIISQLCDGNVIALELVSEKSFHELWSDRDYPEHQILRDITCLYDWLRKFHIATVDHPGQLPYCYGDFGPKNLIALHNDRVAFIDPPLKFFQKDVYYDLGTLVFEIERSLIQASRFSLIWKNRRLAKIWVESDKSIYSYKLYRKGIQRHVFDVIMRYGTFFKKPHPINEFFRGLVLFPCLVFYHILLSAYGVLLRCKMK
jgi:hypothetical protein